MFLGPPFVGDGFFRRLHGTTADTKLQSREPSDFDEADTEDTTGRFGSVLGRSSGLLDAWGSGK